MASLAGTLTVEGLDMSPLHQRIIGNIKDFWILNLQQSLVVFNDLLLCFFYIKKYETLNFLQADKLIISTFKEIS